MKTLLFSIAMSLLVMPFITWSMFKPVRILAPELVIGVTCLEDIICTDDVSRVTEVENLYKDARSFVESSIAKFSVSPRVVFCTSMNCYNRFGFSRASAKSIGGLGIVVGPNGFRDYYIRHEMIHYLQVENLGLYRQWRSPEWFKEGMAYSLSKDPRVALSEPFQQYRDLFDNWYQSIEKSRLWENAKEL